MGLEYIIIAIYIILVLFLTVILPLLCFIFVKRKPYGEKLTSYECGFEPFTNYMPKFEIQYYLVALLFLIFDLELMFLAPWLLCFESLPVFALYSMGVFYILLILGFYYEWLSGGLEWS